MKNNEQQIDVRNKKPQQQQEPQMSNQQQQNGAAIDPVKLMTSEIVTVSQNQQPDDREAEFEEGEFYRGFVQTVVFEMSKREPGWRYPRLKCLIFDRNGTAKPMSWIPFTRQEEASGITAIDPNARQQAPSALVGKEFCAKVTLRRGVTISRLCPVTYLSTPTLAQQGLLETRDTDFCDPAPKS